MVNGKDANPGVSENPRGENDSSVAKKMVICPNSSCSYSFETEEWQNPEEITCEKCTKKLCSKCSHQCHLPASCEEYEKWTNRHAHAQNKIEQQLMEICEYRWGKLDEELEKVEALMTAFLTKGGKYFDLFYENLFLEAGIRELRRTIEFLRWIYVRICFNPLLSSCISMELEDLKGKFNRLAYDFPEPHPDAMWDEGLGTHISNLTDSLERAMYELPIATKQTEIWGSAIQREGADVEQMLEVERRRLTRVELSRPKRTRINRLLWGVSSL